MKRQWKARLQRLALWILKKTGYRFEIRHDALRVDVQRVGVVNKGDLPKAYDFVLKKDNGHPLLYMGDFPMMRHFLLEEMMDTPNPKCKSVRFADEDNMKRFKESCEFMMRKTKESARVVI